MYLDLIGKFDSVGKMTLCGICEGWLNPCMNLALIGVLFIFGNQYIMRRVLSCSVILRSNVLQYLMLVSKRSFLDLCFCEYIHVEFVVFLLGETSVNSLENQYFLHKHAETVSCFINVDSNNFLMKLFLFLFDIWVTQHWFCLFRFHFCLKVDSCKLYNNK